MAKQHISPQELRLWSAQLAMQVVKSGWQPTHLVALWRGGATVGCHVHEVFKLKGWDKVDHIAIRTARFKSPAVAAATTDVFNLNYLTERVTAGSKVLLVDDVYESGLSLAAVVGKLQHKLAKVGKPMPEIRMATVFHKPAKNVTQRVPDYVVHETDAWLVFPHELEGLSVDEIKAHWGPEAAAVLELGC